MRAKLRFDLFEKFPNRTRRSGPPGRLEPIAGRIDAHLRATREGVVRIALTSHGQSSAACEVD
jgi:hypothetical protein